MQRFLVRDGITIYNYYFPWRDKNFPAGEEAIEKLRKKFSLRSNNISQRLDTDILRAKREVQKLQVMAIEQSKKSVPYHEAHYTFPIALVVGNETHGVSKEVLELTDQIVEIPMWGVNKSLNVMVSLGIVLFEVMKVLTKEESEV